MKKYILLIFILILTGCAKSTYNAGNSPDGFFSGLIHGFILPFSFIISLFNDKVSIYAIHNNGGWYDFGFLIGICIIFEKVVNHEENRK